MENRRTQNIVTLAKADLEGKGLLLGRGGMGSVYLYKLKSQLGLEVAVKKLDKASGIGSLKEEAKILWGLHEKCSHILRLHGIVVSVPGVWLVVDYMRFGNVLDFFGNIKNEVSHRPVQEVKLRIAKQVCIGMEFLHDGLQKPVLHCDLKARNVLLDDDLNVKICDFGLAKIKRLTTRPNSDGPSRELGNCHGGTLSHIAPELLNVTGKPSKKTDVYSYAILLWEIFAEKEPYGDVTSDFVLMTSVLNGTRPGVEDILIKDRKLREFVFEIMTDCWDSDPSKRPPFKDLRNRFPNNGKNSIDESVASCKTDWNNYRAVNDPSTTFPKAVRSENGEGYSFATVEVPEGNTPLPHRDSSRRRNHNQNSTQGTVSDLFTSEVLISSSSSGRESSTTCVKEVEYPRYLDGASNAPLLPPSPTPSNRGPSWKCRRSQAAMCMFGLVVGCGAAIAIFWLSLHSLYAGCCINCFDQSSSVIQSNCSVGNESKARVGSRCAFSCTGGYVLNGNSRELVCQSNGLWSGPLPYCRKIRQCSSLKPPANSGEYQCTNGAYEKSTCSFQCKDGYRLRLPGDGQKDWLHDMDITCTADDLLNYRWSGPEPYCEKVISCPQLDIGDGAVATCTPDAQSPTNGTICQLSCKVLSMSLKSDEHIAMCSQAGIWNITKEIKCINACPTLPTPSHGKYDCSNNRTYDSKCTYTCEQNFLLVGSDHIQCQGNGQPKMGTWNADPPTCECPCCRSGMNCENSVSFNETWDVLNKTQNTVFDGRKILCKRKAVSLKNNRQSNGCQCIDQKSNMNKQCNDDNFSLACYKAYGSLILMMHAKEMCPLPCDANNMPKIQC